MDMFLQDMIIEEEDADSFVYVDFSHSKQFEDINDDDLYDECVR